MRIALVSPRGPLYRHRSGIWKKSLRYAPLTLTTLASLIPPELNAEIVLMDEGIRDIDKDIDVDLVGISLITGTAPRSYELAAHFRSRGIPVVLGGVHATLVPDEAQQHCDALVTGYAEETWPQLLRDFAAGRMQRRYDQALGLKLENLPLPRRDLLPARNYITLHTIEATRGCIHKCEFCVVPSAWGRPLHKPIGEVIADVRQMKPKKLIFLDLNLISEVDYAKELFRALIPLRVRWGGLATTMIAWDDELLDLAAESGCAGLLLGFESLSDGALAESRKQFSSRMEYQTVIEKLHARKIAIQGCFVFGFDDDDTSVFERTAQFAIDHHIDLPRYAIMTPFPGTPLHQRLASEGRLLTTDWSYYDGQHVVYRPARMTAEELQQGTERAWKMTYSYRGIFRRLAGARVQLPIAIPANFGYRFYAHHLNKYYTCDWSLPSAARAA
ncbi:MAG: B12-binding domain-containing radical SAM protein [Acidobacteriota bacterium]|nr:B12-binding domain-containing radical SAM protein [Acidobacteriota bacterium]